MKIKKDYVNIKKIRKNLKKVLDYLKKFIILYVESINNVKALSLTRSIL